MSRTVAWHVAARAPCGSNEGRDLVSVGLLDQYLLSEWPDAHSFSLVEPRSGDFGTVGRTRVRTRQKAYSVR